MAAATTAAAAAAAASPCNRAGRHDMQLPHVAIFPFMARGHTVPLIHLAYLLRRRGLATVTLFTTPANAPFVRRVLDDDAVAVVELPFPDHVPGVPRGVECVEGLDGLSSFPAFVEAVSALRPRLEASLAAMRPRVGLLVADARSCTGRTPPRPGSGSRRWRSSPRACSRTSYGTRSCVTIRPPCWWLTATFVVPEFPHVRLTLADIPVPFNDPSPAGPIVDMYTTMAKAIAGSRGLIVNTFDAMEGQYIEHLDSHHVGHRAWPVGPLCLARLPCHVAGAGEGGIKPAWMQWLDEKAAAGRAVLYVALGTLIAVQEAQLRELAGGLEASGLDFLWAVRPSDADLGAGFEERVEGRGMVVREWVDQWRILRHGCV